MTSFYDRHIMPCLIGCACSTKPIMKQREKVVPQATGTVLELGIGGGLNLAFYNLATVEKVVGVDPSEELRERAAHAPRPYGLRVHVRDGTAEALPFEDASFDSVVCTYTLCSVREPPAIFFHTGSIRRCHLATFGSGAAPCSQKKNWPPGFSTRLASANAAAGSRTEHRV